MIGAEDGRKKRKMLEGEYEPCVASIDAAGVGSGSCLWLDVAGAFCPGPAGCGDVGRGGLLFVCADRGDAPRLHQTDGCAVWGSEPSP